MGYCPHEASEKQNIFCFEDCGRSPLGVSFMVGWNFHNDNLSGFGSMVGFLKEIPLNLECV